MQEMYKGIRARSLEDATRGEIWKREKKISMNPKGAPKKCSQVGLQLPRQGFAHAAFGGRACPLQGKRVIREALQLFLSSASVHLSSVVTKSTFPLFTAAPAQLWVHSHDATTTTTRATTSKGEICASLGQACKEKVFSPPSSHDVTQCLPPRPPGPSETPTRSSPSRPFTSSSPPAWSLPSSPLSRTATRRSTTGNPPTT